MTTTSAINARVFARFSHRKLLWSSAPGAGAGVLQLRGSVNGAGDNWLRSNERLQWTALLPAAEPQR
jgi:hypothetical protein